MLHFCGQRPMHRASEPHKNHHHQHLYLLYSNSLRYQKHLNSLPQQLLAPAYLHHLAPVNVPNFLMISYPITVEEYLLHDCGANHAQPLHVLQHQLVVQNDGRIINQNNLPCPHKPLFAHGQVLRV